jgi:hypothetical protein
LLAGAALALAIVYAAIVAIGTVTGLVTRTPLLLPIWSFGLPAGSLLLAWIARERIQGSEGALTGLGLTRWSVRLSVFFVLSYGAYYTATALAVRQQADRFARYWMDLIAQGEIDQAFYWTQQEPHKDLPAKSLRDMLEKRFNAGPDFTAPGLLSGFSQGEYVRLLQLAGPEKAKISLQDIHSWGYQGGGYQVTMTYRIETPLAHWNQLVTAFGKESRSQDKPGREWSIKQDGTGILASSSDTGQSRNAAYTEEGKALVALWATGGREAWTWTEQLKAGKIRGEKIKVAAESLWGVDDAAKKTAVQDVQELLAKGPKRLQNLKLAGTLIPLPAEEGNRMVARYDFQMAFQSPTREGPPTLVDGRLVLSTDKPKPDQKDATWKVEGIELLRTKLSPKPMGPGPG